MNLNSLILKSRNSSFYRWLLNIVLWRAVPFNSPHKFLITAIDEGKVSVTLPFIRKNKNHINGIHACARATVCEYATGLCITSSVSEKDFRIILKSIHIDYFYQGKTDVFLNFTLEKSFVEKEILAPLKNSDAVLIKLYPEIYDTNKNHICTGTIEWQVKNWKNVKTKI